MPSVFSDSKSIQIRLVRNDNEDKDDRILVRYNDEDIYHLFFKDGNTSSKKPGTYCTVLTGDELDTYLQSLLTLLAYDRAPFERVEFQIPCFPCLQFYPKDFRNDTIRETLNSIMPILYSASKY
jgi:hypothetical protein